MKDEDKKLVGRAKARHDMGLHVILHEMVAAIERLSAEVEVFRSAWNAGDWPTTFRDEELAAIRAQIAEAKPVAWIRTARVWIGQDAYEDRSIIVRDKPQESTHEYKPLYLHPAADAKDAERLDWLDKVCSEGNGRHLCCLPGGLRHAIDAAISAHEDSK